MPDRLTVYYTDDTSQVFESGKTLTAPNNDGIATVKNAYLVAIAFIATMRLKWAKYEEVS